MSNNNVTSSAPALFSGHGSGVITRGRAAQKGISASQTNDTGNLDGDHNELTGVPNSSRLGRKRNNEKGIGSDISDISRKKRQLPGAELEGPGFNEFDFEAMDSELKDGLNMTRSIRRYMGGIRSSCM